MKLQGQRKQGYAFHTRLDTCKYPVSYQLQTLPKLSYLDFFWRVAGRCFGCDRELLRW